MSNYRSIKRKLMVFTGLIMSALMILTCLRLTAQPTVTLYGKVVDQNTQAPLIGVNIVIESTKQGALTDQEGKFVLANVVPGSYNITASYIGYESSTRSNVIIISKGNDDLNFELKESTTELDEVVIQASPFQVKTVTPLSIQALSADEIRTYPGGK